jgi:glycosyltransferase involved in cell wall biosynthesis
VTRPLISIITLTFNHEAFIRQCIESVLAQTFCDWEQIIVDDGSTDRTSEIVAEYQDPRIIYIRQEHLGPFGLRDSYNKALAYARGELIAILEGDDFWPEYALETHIGALENDTAIVSHGRAARVSPSGRIFPFPHLLPYDVRYNNPVGSVTRHLLLANWFSHTSTIVIRRGALDRIGGFQGNTALPLVDVPTIMALGMIDKFTYTDKILGYHRYHSKSITISDWTSQNLYIPRGLKNYAIEFYKEHSDELRSLDLKRIEKSWDAAILSSYVGSGRLALYKKEWHSAREFFYKGLKSPSKMLKLIALLGLLSSIVKINILESLQKVFRGYSIEDFV